MKTVNQRLNTTVQTRSIDTEKRTIDIIASTSEKDDYGTRFDQSGWMLERFIKNPVINYAHDDRGHTASAGLPIARAVKETIRVEDGKLQMTVEFPKVGVHEFADLVFNLTRDGFLSGLSVGFVPVEDEVVQEGDELVRWFKRMELYEVSFVTIPSNSGTLVKRCSDLNRDIDEAKEAIEKVETMYRTSDNKVTSALAIEHNGKVYFDEDVRKCIDYFETRKEVLKIANKFMKDVYEREAKQVPSDLLAAWQGVPSLVRTTTTIIAPKKQATATPKPTKRETHVFTGTFNDFADIQRRIEAATVEALRNGLPESQREAFIDKLSNQLKNEFLKTNS